MSNVESSVPDTQFTDLPYELQVLDHAMGHLLIGENPANSSENIAQLTLVVVYAAHLAVGLEGDILSTLQASKERTTKAICSAEPDINWMRRSRLSDDLLEQWADWLSVAHARLLVDGKAPRTLPTNEQHQEAIMNDALSFDLNRPYGYLMRHRKRTVA